VNKKEADQIAWTIIRPILDDQFHHPDPNVLIGILAKIIKEHQAVWDAILRYDGGYDVLCGFCSEDYVNCVRGVLEPEELEE